MVLYKDICQRCLFTHVMLYTSFFAGQFPVSQGKSPRPPESKYAICTHVLHTGEHPELDFGGHNSEFDFGGIIQNLTLEGHKYLSRGPQPPGSAPVSTKAA